MSSSTIIEAPGRPAPAAPHRRERVSSALSLQVGLVTTFLLIIVVLALLGALPTWRHSRSWGYAPSGIVGVVLVVVVVMLLAGRI